MTDIGILLAFLLETKTLDVKNCLFQHINKIIQSGKCQVQLTGKAAQYMAYLDGADLPVGASAFWPTDQYQVFVTSSQGEAVQNVTTLVGKNEFLQCTIFV